MPTTFLNFVTHAATAAVAAVIGWFATNYWERQKHLDEVDKAKIEIVTLAKDRDYTFANALISYYDKKYSKDDQIYADFLKSISDCIASVLPCQRATIRQPDLTGVSGPAQTPQSAVTEISSISSLSLRKQLWSSNRRQYSDHLVDLYEDADADENAKRDLISKLRSTIISSDSSDKQDTTQRYRVNIYVARTSALLPKTHDKELYLALQKLASSPDYSDPTFKQNVDSAIARQGSQ